jgi:hypothetical protein
MESRKDVDGCGENVSGYWMAALGRLLIYILWLSKD